MWIKICGITNEEDALLAVALGADALGFVFAPGSPRQVTTHVVGEILHRLPAGVITVGVFRDEVKERAVEIVNTLGLGGAQLHGREPLSDVRWVRRRVFYWSPHSGHTVPFILDLLSGRHPPAQSLASACREQSAHEFVAIFENQSVRSFLRLARPA